jgi:hypothetical protein
MADTWGSVELPIIGKVNFKNFCYLSTVDLSRYLCFKASYSLTALIQYYQQILKLATASISIISQSVRQKTPKNGYMS